MGHHGDMDHHHGDDDHHHGDYDHHDDDGDDHDSNDHHDELPVNNIEQSEGDGLDYLCLGFVWIFF